MQTRPDIDFGKEPGGSLVISEIVCVLEESVVKEPAGSDSLDLIDAGWHAIFYYPTLRRNALGCSAAGALV
jgi:hypothetical protein